MVPEVADELVDAGAQAGDVLLLGVVGVLGGGLAGAAGAEGVEGGLDVLRGGVCHGRRGGVLRVAAGFAGDDAFPPGEDVGVGGERRDGLRVHVESEPGAVGARVDAAGDGEVEDLDEVADDGLQGEEVGLDLRGGGGLLVEGGENVADLLLEEGLHGVELGLERGGVGAIAGGGGGGFQRGGIEGGYAGGIGVGQLAEWHGSMWVVGWLRHGSD